MVATLQLLWAMLTVDFRRGGEGQGSRLQTFGWVHLDLRGLLKGMRVHT